MEIEVAPILPKPYQYTTATDWACKKNTLESDKLKTRTSLLDIQQNARFVKLQADILEFKDDCKIARMQNKFALQKSFKNKRETTLKRWSSMKDETNSKHARKQQSTVTVSTASRDSDWISRYRKVVDLQLSSARDGSDTGSIESKQASAQECYERVLTNSRVESMRLDNLEKRYSLHFDLYTSKRIRKTFK
ncbi:hypothetical protein ACJMK2_030364 [Sinanodonta woodiana]|uniref:Uncharacterized protein n=1 Tax=Sinanodonta woodiana TaxID=1069815 RepID=A0ABD3XCZ8_SINWO